MEGNVAPAERLGERETAILTRLAVGLSDQQIADDLILSLHTVKWYNRQIYSKLGVTSRTQAIAAAKTLGLLAALPVTSSGAPAPATPSMLPDRRDDAAENIREQRVRFCASSDGVRIAYATVGAGPPLVKAANWLSHLEFDWESPVWRHWLTKLSECHTLIRYDERGCGLSDWNVQELSVDTFVQDLEAVVAALGLERFPLLGISQGGAVAVTYAVRHPEQVSHLILYGAYARGRFNRGYSQHQIEQGRIILDLIKLGWGQDNPATRQYFTSLFMPEATSEQMRAFNALQRISATAENAARIMNTVYRIDVTELVPRVIAPTLVLHARDDGLVPLEEGRHLAALIPGARFVALESKNHILLESEPAWPHFLSETRNFLARDNDS